MLSKPRKVNQKLRKTLAHYNRNLRAQVHSFTKSHRGVQTWVVDTTPAFNKAIRNPTKFGAPDATCENPDGKSCLWFNDYHPGYAINVLVAEEVAQVVGAPFF
jgi:phospholipase/lecithinase/hemolysin